MSPLLSGPRFSSRFCLLVLPSHPFLAISSVASPLSTEHYVPPLGHRELPVSQPMFFLNLQGMDVALEYWPWLEFSPPPLLGETGPWLNSLLLLG